MPHPYHPMLFFFFYHDREYNEINGDSTLNHLLCLQEVINTFMQHIAKAEGNKKEYYELLKVVWSEDEQYIVISFPRCYGMPCHPTFAFISYLEEQGYTDIITGDGYLVIPFDPKKNDLAHIVLMFSASSSKILKTQEPVQLTQLRDSLRYFVLSRSGIEKAFGRRSIICNTPLMAKLWQCEGYDPNEIAYYHNNRKLPTIQWLKEDRAIVSLTCDESDKSFEVHWIDNDSEGIETVKTSKENQLKFRNYIASLSLSSMDRPNSYDDFIELARAVRFSTLENPEFDNPARLQYIFEKIADVTKLGLSNRNYTVVSMNELDTLTAEYQRLRKLLE